MSKKIKETFYLSRRIVFFVLLPISLLLGCGQSSTFDNVEHFIREGEAGYAHALHELHVLLAQGKDPLRAHFMLGKVYFSQGNFTNAILELNQAHTPESHKLLAIAYYRQGSFVDALEAFNKEDISDNEYLYYHGLTCEKLNLFDQAMGFYRKIKGGSFFEEAKKRIDVIERQVSALTIKEVDPQVYTQLQQAPAGERYPQAGALILLADEKIEITPQGNEVSTMHYLVKIINDRKADFSETHIDYDSTYEKVESDFARTITANGIVVPIGTKHIRDVSRYMNFPLYSNARVYIISFPEIAEGAVIEYKVKVYRNQLINKKYFADAYSVQTSEPVISAKFEISSPANMPIRMKVLNGEYNDFGANLVPLKSEQGGLIHCAWDFKNIPQILLEPNMPHDVRINPTVLLSNFTSWDEIYQWWFLLSKDKIRADTAIKKKVIELIKTSEKTEEKIRAISNFCSQNIRYVAVEYGQAGYEPHYAAEVFKNKYGDCKDQAILLVTMLREAGIPSWPVLIPTKEAYNLNEDFPEMLFDHCIAACALEGKLIFMDPTAQTCSFNDLPSGDQARSVLLVKGYGFEILKTPLYGPEHNLIQENMSARIEDDGRISSTRKILPHGLYDQAERYWFLYTAPELVRDTLQEKIQEISIGAKVDNYRVENASDLNTPVVLEYSFHGPEYCIPAGNLRIMPQLAGVDTSVAAKLTRRYPIEFPACEMREASFEFTIPKNFSVKYMPENIHVQNQWFEYLVEYAHKNGSLSFHQAFSLKTREISQHEYPGFKTLLQELARTIKQRVVLERQGV